MTTVSLTADDLGQRAYDLGARIIRDLSPWYQDGVFFDYDMENFHRRGLPHAAMMATMLRRDTDPVRQRDYLRMIREIVNRSIATNTSAEGWYMDGAAATGPFAGVYGQFPDRAAMQSGFGDIVSIEQAANVAWILTQLPAGILTAAEYASWLRVCHACCDKLEATGSLIYYVNGNINAQLLGLLWFTAEATADAALRGKYEGFYETALAFLLYPESVNADRWDGYGLVLSTPPASPDWSDGVGHLTETNGNNPPAPPLSFDPNYSTVQLDALAGVFLYNRDTRVLRVMNVIANKVEPLIDPATWYLDGTGGSRQHNQSAMWGCYHHVLGLLGTRGTPLAHTDPPNLLSMMGRVDDAGNKPGSLVTSLVQGLASGAYPSGLAHQFRLGVAHVLLAAEQAGLKVSG